MQGPSPNILKFMEAMQQICHNVFITGGVQGLGRAFCEALLQQGSKVCIVDIQERKGRQVENDLQQKYGKEKVLFCHCDVSSKQSLKVAFQKALSTFGHINVMVNNAGIADESKLEEMININLVGAIQGSLLAVEHMRRDRGGRGGKIINVASTAGLTGVYVVPLYCSAKFGLVGFHKSWSSNPHLPEMGIQFGCLCPAFTDTAILEYDAKKVLYYDEAVALIKNLGTNRVETVAQAFLQLVNSDNCNGDILTVTKGAGIVYFQKGKNAPSSRI